MNLLDRREMLRAVRRLRCPFASKALILLYHRVAELSSDPQLLAVTPARFEEHLKILREHYTVISLEQLTRFLREGKIPHRSVVLTFDDGYADALYNAKPLLERYDVPATVYVATGFVGADREFYWDELEGLLLRPGNLPEHLSLNAAGTIFQWRLGQSAQYSEADYERWRGWNVAMDNDPTPRQNIYRTLCARLLQMSEEDRENVLNAVRTWAGATPSCRPIHRPLSAEEIVRLSEGGLVEVGAHTMSHAVLSAIPTAAQETEIRESKTRLEAMLGRPLFSFSYPFGKRTDYTEETVAIVRQAGFRCACSNFPGNVCRGADLFQLPRVIAPHCGGKEFRGWLRRWFLGFRR